MPCVCVCVCCRCTAAGPAMSARTLPQCSGPHTPYSSLGPHLYILNMVSPWAMSHEGSCSGTSTRPAAMVEGWPGPRVNQAPRPHHRPSQHQILLQLCMPLHPCQPLQSPVLATAQRCTRLLRNNGPDPAPLVYALLHNLQKLFLLAATLLSSTNTVQSTATYMARRLRRRPQQTPAGGWCTDLLMLHKCCSVNS